MKQTYIEKLYREILNVFLLIFDKLQNFAFIESVCLYITIFSSRNYKLFLTGSYS